MNPTCGISIVQLLRTWLWMTSRCWDELYFLLTCADFLEDWLLMEKSFRILVFSFLFCLYYVLHHVHKWLTILACSYTIRYGITSAIIFFLFYWHFSYIFINFFLCFLPQTVISCTRWRNDSFGLAKEFWWYVSFIPSSLRTFLLSQLFCLWSR